MTTSLQIDPETGKRTYHGYQLIRATPESDDHLDALRFIEKGKKFKKYDLNRGKLNSHIHSFYQLPTCDFPRHQPVLSLICCVAMQYTSNYEIGQAVGRKFGNIVVEINGVEGKE